MRIVLLSLFLFNSLFIFSQDQNVELKQPFIEVIGTATKDVVPDRIFIEIILTEKTIDRKIYTIKEQENVLTSIVQSLNIGMDKLSLSDSNSEILFKRRREKGIILSKEYILEVSNSQQVNSVFESLSNTNIKEASIGKTENSKITEIRKEVRIEAIKVAKDKAKYLLEAIDEKLGLPLEIRELTMSNHNIVSQSNIASIRFNQEEINSLNFEMIEVRFSYYIKYAIKGKTKEN